MKMAKESYSNIILSILSNGKIVYYQYVLQLPVPLNTLNTIHSNAKSHDQGCKSGFFRKAG